MSDAIELPQIRKYFSALNEEQLMELAGHAQLFGASAPRFRDIVHECVSMELSRQQFNEQPDVVTIEPIFMRIDLRSWSRKELGAGLRAAFTLRETSAGKPYRPHTSELLMIFVTAAQLALEGTI